VIEPSGVTPGGINTEYYSLVGTPGVGAASGQLAGGQNGAAVFVVDAYGIQVRDDAIDSNWHDVKTAFVNVNGVWRQTFAAFIYQNNAWQMVIGGAALTFAGQNGEFGRVSRPADRRALPPPPPVVYDSIRQTGCFIAGTQITMADGSTKSIEDVVIGDQVIGKDGVINTVQEYIRPLLGDRTLVGFNSGTPFITSDHPIWVRGHGWRSFDPAMTYNKYSMTVGKYSVGDVIETQDNVGFEILSIEEHSNQNPNQVIYSFALDGNNTYIANNLVVHNKPTGLGRGGVGSAGSSGGNGSGASTAGGSSPGSAYSDARLKHNIELIDTLDDGLKIYSFNYAWSDIQWVGVIAQDLLEHTQFSHAVKLESNGFYSVDYSKINFEMITADQYRCLHRET
jgi:hypothetical protein